MLGEAVAERTGEALLYGSKTHKHTTQVRDREKQHLRQSTESDKEGDTIGTKVGALFERGSGTPL